MRSADKHIYTYIMIYQNGVCLVGKSFPHPVWIFCTQLEPPSCHNLNYICYYHISNMIYAYIVCHISYITYARFHGMPKWSCPGECVGGKTHEAPALINLESHYPLRSLSLQKQSRQVHDWSRRCLPFWWAWSWAWDQQIPACLKCRQGACISVPISYLHYIYIYITYSI
jgi:hypothetical protein